MAESSELSYNAVRDIQLPAFAFVLYGWHPTGGIVLNERSAVDSLLFPVKLEP